MAFATISELTNGREISLGLGPGSRSILTHQVERAKPLTIMAELAIALRKLFAGEALKRADIPVLASYFHLNAEQYALRFKTQSPIRLYYGPSLLKPAVLELIARHFDGVILQTLYGIADMNASLARLQSARSQSPAQEPLRKVMLLNASVSRDGQAARQHAKRFVSHIVSGWPDEVLEAKGIDPVAIQTVRRAYVENRGVDYAASLTPDEAVDRLIISGTAAQCSERIAELFSLAIRDGFTQVAIGVPPRARNSRSDRPLGQRNPASAAIVRNLSRWLKPWVARKAGLTGSVPCDPQGCAQPGLRLKQSLFRHTDLNEAAGAADATRELSSRQISSGL